MQVFGFIRILLVSNVGDLDGDFESGNARFRRIKPWLDDECGGLFLCVHRKLDNHYRRKAMHRIVPYFSNAFSFLSCFTFRGKNVKYIVNGWCYQWINKNEEEYPYYQKEDS